MRPFSIPRVLLVAMAMLLAFVIFIIVAHPYFNVSKATAADQMAALVFAIVQVLATGAACVLIVFHSLPIAVSQMRPIPIVERNRIRRI